MIAFEGPPAGGEVNPGTSTTEPFFKGRRLFRRRLLAVVAAVTVVAGVTLAPPAAVSVRSVSHAAIRLAGDTFGVGGSFDGFGLTIPLNFWGTIVPPGDTYHFVPYPGQINFDYPVISDLPYLSDLPYWPQTLIRSADKGAKFLLRDLATIPLGGEVTMIGLSQGAQVLELVRAAMAQDPTYVANAQHYHFTMLGNPYTPNGGILARFTWASGIPVLNGLFPFGRPGPSDSPFPTDNIVNQYDGVADFPQYFNTLAIVNALAGIAVQHIFPGYVLDDPNDPNAVTTTVGNTTYTTIPKLLPLLQPFHAVASLIGAQRFVDFLDPILRVIVEAGYDRTTDPSEVRPFSFATPEAKIAAAIAQMPAAINQSLAILSGQPYHPTVGGSVVSSQPSIGSSELAPTNRELSDETIEPSTDDWKTALARVPETSPTAKDSEPPLEAAIVSGDGQSPSPAQEDDGTVTLSLARAPKHGSGRAENTEERTGETSTQSEAARKAPLDKAPGLSRTAASTSKDENAAA